VSGIHPTETNTVRQPAPGSLAAIVGFGVTDGSISDGIGVKREGKVATIRCSGDFPADTLLCWNYTGAQSNTCFGDSGGPLFWDVDGRSVVAGVSSGGSDDFCRAPDLAFDTDVFADREWLANQLINASTECAIGAEIEEILSASGVLNSNNREVTLSVDVPRNATQLRLGLNGQLWNDSSGPGGSTQVDFDLEVSSPDGSRTWSDTGSTSIGYCEFPAPAAGAWRVTISRLQGQGTYQLVASLLPGASTPSCTGDCNQDGSVTKRTSEGVNIVLGADVVSDCSPLDVNRDDQISVDEVVSAVTMALSGCDG
jgi:hypothetical protein